MGLTIAMALSLIGIFPVYAASTEVTPGIGTLATAVTNAKSGDTLALGDGVYYVTKTLYINKTLTIKAKEGTHPIITGSTPVTGWESVGGGIYRAAYSSTNMPMVIENGETATIARYPNAPENANFTDGYLFSTGGEENGQTGKLTFSGSLPSGISSDALQMVAWGSKWTNYANTVLKVTAVGSGSVSYHGVMKYGVSDNVRFYLRGDKALIDVPGEYALYGGYLYYYPYDASNLETSVSASAPFGDVLCISGSNVSLSGLSVKGTALGTFKTEVSHSDFVIYNNDNTAIRITGSGTMIDHCLFDGIGSGAIVTTGNNTTVQNSTFQNIGSNAVSLKSSGNNIVNNLITKTGRESGGGGAINIEGSNNTIAHNEIFDHPRWAVNGYGNISGNVVEYNDLYNCNTDSSDTGLIYFYYTASNSASDANIIRYNHVHDSTIYGGMGFGIYLDDDCGYFKVYGNLIDHLDAKNLGHVSAPLMVKGWENEVYNNIIAVNQNLGSNFDEWNTSGNIIVQRLTYNNVTRDNRLHHNVIYENKNPTLLDVMMDSPSSGIKECDYNLYYVNAVEPKTAFNAWCKYYVNASGIWQGADSNAWQNLGFDKHTLFDTDPGFVDGLNRDFHLKADSPLLQMGFEPLPLEEMGRLTGEVAPTAQPTELPPGVTESPTPVPTPVPTEVPTPTPRPTTDPNAAVFTMTEYKNEHGGTASNTKFENGTLSLTKDISGAYYISIPVNDKVREVNENTVYTLSFDALITDGYIGDMWDGYRITFRGNGESCILRLSPAEGQLTGLSFSTGNPLKTVEGGTRHFDIVYNSKTADIYVDGEKVLTNESFDFGGNLQSIWLIEGKDEATMCHLELSDFSIYNRDIVNDPILPPVILGDVDGSGAVNAKDVTHLRRMIAAGNVPEDKRAADINGDGKVDAKDVTHLRRLIAAGQ